ncbi:MAG: translation initiation factor IF-2 N-terminal domain-containing protein, partial [Thermoleophilaceae bacterium]|nr:translation initiation factor IF-2 N-terminal domain-containing protein [Thermoleophilaceae bacterium]
MAKKRVHEIAKERGMPSKDVIVVLQKAGLDVKAAASSVDDADVSRAFDGGPADEDAAADNGAGQSPAGAAEGQDRPAQDGQTRARPTRGGRGGEQA